MPNNGLSFTSAEIFRSAEMDRDGFYIVVEGVCDKPIFSELLTLLREYGVEFSRPIIGAGGGKPNILGWLEAKPEVNVKVVLDRDFDDPDHDLVDERIIPLSVYSIENYYFTLDVVAPLFANLTNSTIEEVMGWLSIDGLTQNWCSELSDLVAVLYYYQKVFRNEKDGWGDTDIVKSRENWNICSRKVSAMINKLLEEMEGVTVDECKNHFERSHIHRECLSVCFPGKLIKKSFYRYLKCHCMQNGGDFSTVTNVDQLMQSLTSRLMRNPDLRNVLERLVS